MDKSKVPRFLAHPVVRRRFGVVGNIVGHINKVNQHQAHLELGWVTVNHLSMLPATQVDSAWPPLCGLWVGAM